MPITKTPGTHSSRVSAILRSTLELRQPVHAVGVTAPCAALVIARFLATSSASAVSIILCPDDETAAELATDTQTLSQSLLNHTPNISIFPGWDQSPYSPVSPSIRTRFMRVSALEALSLPQNGPRAVFTSIRALSQVTMPRSLFESSRLPISAGVSIGSRESLTLKLLEAGYQRVETVEDEGTFAIRGEIVDIFPPGRARPLRIELFDDTVERLREFDPTSQRTFANSLLGEHVLGPAREVLVNPASIPVLRENLKSRADDLGISRASRDPLLSLIADGGYPEHSDVWVPFAYRAPGSLFDYVGTPYHVIWFDELACTDAWEAFHKEQVKLELEAPASGLVLPPFRDLYAIDLIEPKLRAGARLFLDRLEVVKPENPNEEPPATPENILSDSESITSHHRIFISGTGGLRQKGPRQFLDELESRLQLWKKQGFRILILASTQTQLERIRFLLEERGFTCQQNGTLTPSLITLCEGLLSEGFCWPAEGLVILNESEILGVRRSKAATHAGATSGNSSARKWSGLQVLSDLSPGDLVVHVDHGIGRYQGLVRLDLSGAPSDFLLLEYANRDKLYLPVYRLNVIQKYAASGDSALLDKLGTHQFSKAKEKVREAVRKLAFDLVQLYAKRKIQPGLRFSPRDSEFREFEAKFPFDETPDQLNAIDQILASLESGRVMDHLVCGDVGYGKTEVAMRAAFRAVTEGKQVAVLVPTTVLAFQHEQSFKTRFRDYPVVIESVSRFKPLSEQKKALHALSSGKVDIIIGTHRLLSADVCFRDLGLIIVDEEHRFGVEHKELLKTLRINTHVLTLTATPIPRTLHMALSGLREISLINTPPINRLPIRTYISKFDEPLIEKAIRFELNRGGQVFFLHNRVDSIQSIVNRVRELIPEAQVAAGHGQMAEGELEKTMLAFYERKVNVLVCTTIIESGLDVPNANTIIINRADMLGLAQLYQIRGRVGRGQQRAYAYLLVPAEGAVTADAKKRLEVIQRFVELGSGFSIASHDLEIRGGGDLLGAQQSGHIAAVGFDLYTELLEEAIQEIEGKPANAAAKREPEIKAPFPAFLAEEYVPDVHQRLSLYRRLSGASEETELTALEEELADRFGPLPTEARNLLWMIQIKILLKRLGVETLTVGRGKVSMVPGAESALDPVRAIALVSSQPTKFQIMPDSKFVAHVPTESLSELSFALEGLLRSLSTPV